MLLGSGRAVEVGMGATELSVGSWVVHQPAVLVSNCAHLDDIGTSGKFIDPHGPQGEGETEKENRLDENDADLEVGGGVAFDAVVVGFRVAAAVEAEQADKKENRPTDEENEHEPMQHFEHVVDHVAVFGGHFGQADASVDHGVAGAGDEGSWGALAVQPTLAGSRRVTGVTRAGVTH